MQRPRRRGSMSGMDRCAAALVLALAAPGCNSSITSSNNGSPADGFAPALDPNPVVRVAAAGVSPSVTHLATGTQVVFTNEGTREVRIVSAPDLLYGACPEADAVGTLAPGQSKAIVLSRAVMCAFRDDGRKGDHAFEGLLYSH